MLTKIPLKNKTIIKVGNSLCITIDASYFQNGLLKIGQKVDAEIIVNMEDEE